MTISEQKKEIRQEMKELKKTFSKEELSLWSEEITRKLEELSLFRLSSVIGYYHSLPDEVQTHSSIDKWSKDKKLYLPTVKEDTMEFVRYRKENLTEKGSFGISEPKLIEEDILKEKPDLIIVPGVAFDHLKNRLGRGKGYYDRYLSDRKIPLIGICYDFQLLEKLPVEEFDRKMDIIVTEQRIIG